MSTDVSTRVPMEGIVMYGLGIRGFGGELLVCVSQSRLEGMCRLFMVSDSRCLVQQQRLVVET